jgi:hypothetical protein
MSLYFATAGDGGFFERRGREDFAEGAKEDRKKNKTKKNTNSNWFFKFDPQSFLVFFCIPFCICLLLRSLRNLSALCVQKIPSPPSPSKQLKTYTGARA